MLLPPHLKDRDADRFARYRENLAFFAGQREPRWRRSRSNLLVVNYARALIRKSASYLMGNPPKVRVISELGEDATQKAQQEIERMVSFNRLNLMDYQVAVDAAVLGDGAFRLRWHEETGAVAVSPVDVQGLWVWCDANHRPERVAELVAVAPHPGGPTIVEEWTEQQTVVYFDGEVVERRENPYGLLPYVVFPNEPRPMDFWGESDLEDLKEPCRELNRRLSVVAQILDVSGNPVVVLENVRGSENIQVEPGALWELPEQSRAYLLDLLSGGGVRLHLEYIDLLYRVIHDLAEVPRTAFGDTGGRLNSGVALQLELQPLLQKVERRRAVWSEVIADRATVALRMMETHGLGPFGAVEVQVIWPPLLSPSEPEPVAAWYPPKGYDSSVGALRKVPDADGSDK